MKDGPAMLKLLIGNKNYSSWSLRPWVLMQHHGIEFREVMLRFDAFTPDSQFKQSVLRTSPAGKVPVLVDGELAIWDTLAIAEYLAETFPAKPLWPQHTAARARARSLSAEMHSGYGQLRNHCPMNIEAHLPEVGARLVQEQPGLRSDLQRLQQAWSTALQASGGPFLFGEFGIVDAFFAPVVSRLKTYSLPVDATAAAYAARVRALPAMAQWEQEARAEHHWVAEDEPYRQLPTAP
jgi:glutathione S-transferase